MHSNEEIGSKLVEKEGEWERERRPQKLQSPHQGFFPEPKKRIKKPEGKDWEQQKHPHQFFLYKTIDFGTLIFCR